MLSARHSDSLVVNPSIFIQAVIFLESAVSRSGALISGALNSDALNFHTGKYSVARDIIPKHDFFIIMLKNMHFKIGLQQFF